MIRSKTMGIIGENLDFAYWYFVQQCRSATDQARTYEIQHGATCGKFEQTYTSRWLIEKYSQVQKYVFQILSGAEP